MCMYIWGWSESSRPSLHETQDKWPLDRESDRSWCHRHTTSMIKLFLVEAHDSMGIGGSIWARWKVLSLAYNRCQIQDKRPLGKDPNRSWCHTRMLRPMSMEPWGCDQKSFKLTYLTTSSPAPSVIPSMWTRLKIVCPLEWMTTGPAPTFSTTYPFQSQSTPDLINSLLIPVGMYVYSLTYLLILTISPAAI
jgi:hypothetical protein